MTPLLLSKRQAAKLLGIGRDTLAEILAGGHIRTVDLLGQTKIPREELERFAREGTKPVASRLRESRRRSKTNGDGIRALVIT